MSTIKVVTTLHEDGYNLYGKKYINSWTAFFPEDWKIDYYAEKHDPVFNQRVNVLDFNTTCPEWLEYYTHIKNLSKTLQNNKEKNRLKKALRWSFKMFTLLHALKNKETRYVIWMDADVYASKSPSDNWLDSVLKNKCIAGQLEHVKGFPHVETGILIIDTEHPDIQKIISWIEKGYIQKHILNESKPWDGAWIGKLFVSDTVECNNIRVVVRDNVARSFTTNSLQWLTHSVGDFKFPNNYSGRSGRTESAELI